MIDLFCIFFAPDDPADPADVTRISFLSISPRQTAVVSHNFSSPARCRADNNLVAGSGSLLSLLINALNSSFGITNSSPVQSVTGPWGGLKWPKGGLNPPQGSPGGGLKWGGLKCEGWAEMGLGVG